MKKLITSAVLSLLFTAGAYAQNCVSSFGNVINGSTVTFTNSSTTTTTMNGSVYYNWNFGDGATSSATNPTHSYTSSGLYLVCLNVYFVDSAAGLSCSDNYCDSVFITVNNPNPLNCSANFYSWLDTSAVSMTMVFGAYTPGPTTGTTTYSWDYGDGNNSVQSNFWHQYTYAQPGVYTACLTITVVDSGQTCTDTYCDSVVVVNTAPPVPTWCNASFYVDSSSTNAAGIFIYNNSTPVTSGSASTSYYWDFGDGNSSNQAYPTHQYASSGLYNLCLTIVSINYSTNDTCIDTHCHTVGVDSLGNVYYKTNGPGFDLNVLDPASIGLNEDALANVQLYPNPTNGELSIDLGNQIDGDLTWSLYDLKGMNLGNGELNEVSTKIDLSKLNSGIYLLNVSNGVEVSQHKVQILK